MRVTCAEQASTKITRDRLVVSHAYLALSMIKRTKRSARIVGGIITLTLLGKHFARGAMPVKNQIRAVQSVSSVMLARLALVLVERASPVKQDNTETLPWDPLYVLSVQQGGRR